jgi:hypothetical protein
MQMKKLWISASLSTAVMLAGCASVYDNAVAANVAATVVINNTCKKAEIDPALAILRGKIPLYGNDRTVAMFNNVTKPNDAERQVLEVYLQSVTDCYVKLDAAVSKYKTKDQKALAKTAAIQDYILISDLKGGILSWADFNRAESNLFSESAASNKALITKMLVDEQETKAAMAAFGQALAQGMQQYGNAMSRAYAPQQQYGSSYAPTPAYEPATTWTSHGNIVQGSNGVTMQSFGNRDVITYPNGQTRNCSTFGNITTCSSPPGF